MHWGNADKNVHMKIENGITGDEENFTEMQMEKPNIINGHECVDLGLSIKWAACNIGASTPSDYGDYYAWGETSTKSLYTEDNSITFGKNMGSIAGDSRYDAARAKWGGSWRLPTASEIYELVSKCKREWTTMGGHKGYKVTGPNGKSIFLPAAGWRGGTSLYNAGESGDYWSATPYEDYSNIAYIPLLLQWLLRQALVRPRQRPVRAPRLRMKRSALDSFGSFVSFVPGVPGPGRPDSRSESKMRAKNADIC